jgi:endonuclease III
MTDKSFCPPDLAWESKTGVKEYIQKRSREDPYFAVVTGALHSGQVTYDKQQKFVEKIMKEKKKHGIKTLLDESKVRKTLHKAQLWEGKSRQLVKSTECYIDVCGVQGRECLTKPKVREDLVSCMQSAQSRIRRELSQQHPEWLKKSNPSDKMTILDKKVQSAGFGQKTSDLVREYLGDNNAVAVDRHVGAYVCNTRGFCPVMKKGGKFNFDREAQIPPHIYRQIANEIRAIAKECHKKPADVQVAAWTKGVCDSRLREHMNPRFFVGEGKYVDCKQRKEK